MQDLIFSIDLGTSGMKCTVFDAAGSIVTSAAADYQVYYGAAGEAEQNPQDWYAALVQCCHMIQQSHPGVLHKLRVAGVSGQMMGVVCIDQERESIGNALIHADVRAEQDNSIFNWESRADDFERIYELSGHRPSAAYSGPKISWLKKHDRERYDKSHCFIQPKDYINLRLTGEVYSDFSDASGTLLYNLKSRAWDTELCETFSVEVSKLPTILSSHSLAGAVSKQASRETGLPHGMPVAIGAGDGICAGIGAGSVKEGIAYNYIGTTAWVATSSKEPVIDPSFRVFTFAHAVEGLYHPMGTMQSAGAVIKWVREQLFSNYHSDDIAYRAMDKVIQESEAGCKGVVFMPYLAGERSPWWKSNMKAGWMGLGNLTGFADQIRAVYEGVANNLAFIAEILNSITPFKELSLLGGGGLSEVLPQILSDAFQKPVKIHRDSVSVTSRGAAVISAVATGMYESYDEALQLVDIDRVLEPNASDAAKLLESRKKLEETVLKLYFS